VFKMSIIELVVSCLRICSFNTSAYVPILFYVAHNYHILIVIKLFCALEHPKLNSCNIMCYSVVSIMPNVIRTASLQLSFRPFPIM
jgi:hypothetical protein